MNQRIKIINRGIFSFMLAGLILFCLAGVCLAQDDTLNLTTYFPAPFGTYSLPRLFPIEGGVGFDGEGTICSSEGSMYYDGDDSEMLYCYDDGINLVWRPIAGEGEHWILADLDGNGIDDSLYTADSVTASPMDWHVGIGTETPAAKFHVDGTVLFTGPTFDPGAPPAIPPEYPCWSGYVPVLEEFHEGGPRLMYVPERGALRIGEANNAMWNIPNPYRPHCWDEQYIGCYSFGAAGLCPKATGTYSTALGQDAVADGTTSTAIGSNPSSLSGAIGGSSTMIGSANLASGQYSVAIGEGNEASGIGSTAIGNRNLAIGNNSFALGVGSEAHGNSSIALNRKAWALDDYSAVVSLDNIVRTIGPPPESLWPHCDTDRSNQFKLCGDLKVEGTITLGDATTYGTLTAETVSGYACPKFKIPHPDPSKPEGTFLKHSAVEAPTAGDNIYRFTVDVKDGKAIIRLPDYYSFLNKDDMALVFPVKHFGRAYGEIDKNQQTLTVYANFDGEYNVILIGTRKDEAAIKYWDGPEVYEPELSSSGNPQNEDSS
ncbi:MAG: hypothetical protein ABH954_03635 [Candidatus Omnitrophota bacterium]